MANFLSLGDAANEKYGEDNGLRFHDEKDGLDISSMLSSNIDRALRTAFQERIEKRDHVGLAGLKNLSE